MSAGIRPPISRRALLGGGLGAGALTLAVPARLLAGAGERRRSSKASVAGYGPLRPARDSTTGLDLLALPEGFSYSSFGWAGEPMSNGESTPASHDGMGVVGVREGRIVLTRNHELTRPTGAFGPESIWYDRAANGGTTTIEFDPESRRGGVARPTLSGTLQNCAGGVTPWGTWLSCEEWVTDAADIPEILGKSHGFVFEVSASGGAPRRLDACGLFRHEAAVVHRPTGDVYLTEDRTPRAGFYRMRPEKPGDLSRGVLQMLAVEGRSDLRSGVHVGATLRTSWRVIADPGRAHSPGTRDGVGVLMQGLEAGGAEFTRLEGCFTTADTVYFTSTDGGDAQVGQVWAYRPAAEELTLLFEARDREQLNYPDNLCFSPRGGLLLCEDGDRLGGQYLQGLSAELDLFTFARNQVVLENSVHGHIGDFRRSEWAGVCFSPDGRWLFASVFNPGFTVAITGPWRRGLI